MTYLEIDLGSGDRRTVELDKRQPLSIGRHPSNDVNISGGDVELMHCRISWHKSAGYQIVAAGLDGVDVNGTLVQKAKLSPGDVLRIGPANIVFRDDEASPPETADFEAQDARRSTYSLKPLSGEIDFPLPEEEEELPPLTADEIITDDPVLTADEIITGEPREEEPRRRKKKRRSQRPGDGRSKFAHDAPRVQRETERVGGARRAAERVPGDPADERGDQRVLSRGTRPDREADVGPPAERAAAEPPMRERFRPRPQRPGDRDPARSPFVLTLGGGALALLLIGATFYFMLGRQTTQAEFNAAQALMEEGKYAQAITAFEDFLALHPRDSLGDAAEVQMWISRIERQASGASPDWSKALGELQGLISARRDGEGFEELHDTIRKRAEAIAEGAATTAGKTKDRTLLAVSDDAASLLTIYAPQSAPPTDALKRIEAARRVSEASILKHEAFVGAVAEMDAALKQQQTMAALGIRRRLLARYPDFAGDATIAAKLKETLRIERELVTRSDEGTDALTADHEAAFPPPLSPAFHARSRTDEVSVGRTVFGIAKDVCYAVDSITGEPVWRRAIGWDTPFFPVPVTVKGPALLVFDTHYDELLLLDQHSGGLLWRQPAVRGVTGDPLIEEGQTYVVSEPATLSKLDLETGRLISRLQFSQSVSSPAALNDNVRLVACGDQEVLYTLTKRPLECAAVSFLGHKPKSIAAPLLPMGGLLLVAENLHGEQANLHVLDCRDESDTLAEIANREIPGHVVDVPVIRGRDLFVPSSGERISSFAVSDEPGQPPLTDGPRYEADGSRRGPLFLATGPDRQVWMAGRYLRKLKLTADAVEPGPQLVNIGTASQPLQQLGNRIYIGRTLPFSTAMTIFQADRDQLASQWQTVLGGRILAVDVFPDQQGFVAVSESGDVFRISASNLDNGGFLTETTVRLKVPEGLATPLAATTLADGRVAAWCGGSEPQMWLINRLGQIDRNFPLPGVLQAAPVQLGSWLALPLSGRIHVVGEGGGGARSAFQGFTLPQGGTAPPAWRQLAGIDGTTLVAATEAGELRLLRQQDTPQPHLAVAGLLDVGAPIDFDFAVEEGRIGFAAGGRLLLIDAAGLEPVAEAQLDGAVSNDVWLSAGCLFVETGRTSVHCYDTESDLTRRWSVPLPQVSLSAGPYVGEGGKSVILSLRDGTILNIDAQSGETLQQQTVGQSLSSGPRSLGAAIAVAAEDGSLIRVESILESQPGTGEH